VSSTCSVIGEVRVSVIDVLVTKVAIIRCVEVNDGMTIREAVVKSS
jgi:hypothetical protein